MTVAALSLLQCYFFMEGLKNTPLVGPLFCESFFLLGSASSDTRVDNHSVIHALFDLMGIENDSKELRGLTKRVFENIKK